MKAARLETGPSNNRLHALAFLLLAGLALAPSVLLILPWWLFYADGTGAGTLSFLAEYYSGEYFRLLASRPGELLTSDNYFLADGDAGAYLGWFFRR